MGIVLYKEKKYKRLVIIPIILLIPAIFFASQVKLGIELTGGMMLSASTTSDIDISTFRSAIIAKFELEDLSIKKVYGINAGFYLQFIGEKSLLQANGLFEKGDYAGAVAIYKNFVPGASFAGSERAQALSYQEAANTKFDKDLISFVSQNTGVGEKDIKLDRVTPALGTSFLQQARNALIVSFIFIIILVFFFFRTPIISFAVIQAAFYDVIFGVMAMGALGIPISIPTLAPLLMLIGYSVDTDIMLTNRVLTRKSETPCQRAKSALATGLTMTGTTIAALFAIFVISTLANITMLSSISIILIVGLLGDIAATWFTNAPLTIWYVEKHTKVNANA